MKKLMYKIKEGKKMINLIASLLIVLTVTISSSHANLVLDGGFEGLPGYYGTGSLGAWTLNIAYNSAGVYEAGQFSGANVTEGSNAFDMGMGGSTTGNSISQTLATIAGNTYSLSFDWGSEYDWGTDSIVTVGNFSAALVDEFIEDPYPGYPAYPEYKGIWIQNSSVFYFTANGNDVHE